MSHERPIVNPLDVPTDHRRPYQPRSGQRGSGFLDRALPARPHAERDGRAVPGDRADLAGRRLGRRARAPRAAIWIRGRVFDGAGDRRPRRDGRDLAGRPGRRLRRHPRTRAARRPTPASAATPARRRSAGEFAVFTLKPGRVPDGEGGLQAPHIDVSLFARGILDRVVTRIYFADEAEANAEDVVLRRLPAERRAHPDRRRRPTTATASTSTCRATARPCSSRYELSCDRDARMTRTVRRHLRARGSGRAPSPTTPGSGRCSRPRPRWPGRPRGSASCRHGRRRRRPRRAADPGRLDLATVVAKAADAGNPVPPLVRALQDAVGERDAVAVHVGATSQDILDTALVLLARNAIAAIDADLRRRGRRRPPGSPPRTGTTSSWAAP